MAWIDTNWQQDDSINSGYPYPVGANAPIGFSYNDIYKVWHFTDGVNNDYPYTEEVIKFDYDGIYSIWKQNDSLNNGYPYTEEVIKFDYDGIYSIWKMDSPTLSYYPYTHMPIMLGAFNYCKNLTGVIIPESVKYIGPYAFWETGLTEVTIAADCEYFEHSFPFGCKINYYGEVETNFETSDKK